MPDAPSPWVCLVVPMPPPYGGIANWSAMLTGELDRQGIPYSLVDVAPSRRSVDGRSFYERFVLEGLAMFGHVARIRGLLREGCRVFHFTTSGRYALVRDFVLVGLVRLYGGRSLYHIRHGRVPEISRSGTAEWRLMKAVMRHASIVIAIDCATYGALAKEMGTSKVVQVPNPIDLSTLPSLRAATSRNLRTVLFVGWVIREKGVEELLDAWGKFWPSHNDWSLRIAGPVHEEYRSHLQRKYGMDGVEMLGEVSHVAALALISECDIFVLPSYTEGFPNVILEAMAMERAVIGTTVGAVPEMLGNDCGACTMPGDSGAIYSALCAYADNAGLRKVVGANARRKVGDMYDLGVVLEQYRRLWAGIR